MRIKRWGEALKSRKIFKMRSSYHSPKAKAARVQAYAGRKYRRFK